MQRLLPRGLEVAPGALALPALADQVVRRLGGLAGGNASGAATSTNNNGSVVVGYSNVGGSAIRAFLWTPATGMRDLVRNKG